MADILSTSGINDLVSSYIGSEQDKRITPYNTQKSKYQTLSNAYTTLSSKVLSLKTLLTTLKTTGSSSPFQAKSATTSNASFVTVSATNSASASAYSMRVNQLAKNDLVLSQSLTSSTARADLAGTHTFVLKTGDGEGGEYTGNVDVELTSSETNQTIMEKLRNAVNTNKAIVTSAAKTGTDAYAGGASSFVLNLNGTETTISVNGGGTYSDLLDEVAANINSNISGVTAEKVSDSPNPGDVKLKLTVTDSTKYLSITHSSGTDIVSDLGISAAKVKSTAGMLTASVFAPSTGASQLSLTANNSGLDNRITSLSDAPGSSLLAQLGLNLGATRTAANQGTNTAGFLYTDITTDNNLLNAKVNFNGIDIQRNSNSINDLAEGITFSLKSVMQVSDQTVNIATSNDITSVKTKINDFITKFNDIYSTIKNNSGSKDGVRGALISDSNSVALIGVLRNIASTSVSGLSSGSLNKLSDLGITFDPNAGLSVSNSTLLDDVLTNKASQVENIFNSTNGLAATLYDKITPFIGSAGYLTSAKTTADRNVRRINDQITAAQSRIDASAENLRNKYQKMQAQLASMYMMAQQLGSGGFS